MSRIHLPMLSHIFNEIHEESFVFNEINDCFESCVSNEAIFYRLLKKIIKKKKMIKNKLKVVNEVKE